MKTIKELKAEYEAYHTSLRNVELLRPEEELVLRIPGCRAAYYADDDLIVIDTYDVSISPETARALGEWLVAITEDR